MKNSFTIFFLLTFFFASAQTYVGDTWGQVKTNGSGTITLAYVETPSFVYKDKSGKITGICVDIMTDFVKWVNDTKGVKLGSKYVGDGSNFRGMYDKVKGSIGGVVGLGNVTITDERKKEVKFSPPFITNFAILITNGTVPTLAKFEDLPVTFAGLTGYAAKGTTNEKRVLELKQKYFSGMKITGTTTSQETLEKVVGDPKGFAYLDLAFYLEATQMNKGIKRHPIGDKAAEQFGFIMPMNSDWSSLMADFFADNGGYLNSQQYRSVLVKHLGEPGMKLMKLASK